MPIYKLKVTAEYHYEVEAENEEEAKKQAADYDNYSIDRSGEIDISLYCPKCDFDMGYDSCPNCNEGVSK